MMISYFCVYDVRDDVYGGEFMEVKCVYGAAAE